MKRIRSWTLRHKVATAVLTTLLLTAAVAAAYLLSSVTFTGENTGTLPKQSGTAISEPLTVTVPEGLTPGAAPEVSASVKPAKEVHLEPGAKLAATFTTVPSSCKASWFELKANESMTTGLGAQNLLKAGGTTEAITLPASTTTAIKGLELLYRNEAAENQSPCSEAKLTVKLTITGTGH